MHELSSTANDVLLASLARRVALSDADRHAVAALPLAVRVWEPQTTVVHEGEPSSYGWLVLEGWIGSHQMLDEGRRAILSLHVPGDFAGLQGLYLPIIDVGMATLSAAMLACVPLVELRRLAEASPAVAEALWEEVLVQNAIQRAWSAGLARRDARSRLAHLFCELSLRLEPAEPTEGHAFTMPLRQTDLADILGLTSVHVNRVLTEMRASGLIRLKGRRLEIARWRELVEIAGFDPRYLHIPPKDHAVKPFSPSAPLPAAVEHPELGLAQ